MYTYNHCFIYYSIIICLSLQSINLTFLISHNHWSDYWFSQSTQYISIYLCTYIFVHSMEFTIHYHKYRTMQLNSLCFKISLPKTCHNLPTIFNIKTNNWTKKVTIMEYVAWRDGSILTYLHWSMFASYRSQLAPLNTHSWNVMASLLYSFWSKCHWLV